MTVITSALVYLNSFTRCQHLFNIAAIPTDTDSNFMSYHAPLSLSQFRPNCNQLICWWY